MTFLPHISYLFSMPLLVCHYQRSMAGNADSDKKEFLADVLGVCGTGLNASRRWDTSHSPMPKPMKLSIT
jgi:hypothetical protein